MMVPFLLFTVGLVLLPLSGDALVRGAVAIATRFHVPPLIIGLTIISMGTSAPEFFVSVQAALNHAPGLSVGNAVGSNIANALIVLGLPALIAPLYFTTPGIRRSAVFMLVISFGFIFLAFDGLISSLDGLILVLALIIYLIYSIVIAQKARREKIASIANVNEEIPSHAANMTKSLAFLGFGFIGLGIGAKLIVDGALELASIWGIGETVVGTTIVALGTTLPEIAATLAASFRREAGVAIGNVIGSNIFNILGILGVTAIMVPLPVTSQLLSFDIWILLISSSLFIPLAFLRRPIGIKIGIALTLTYLAYLFIALSGLTSV
jgi:cation:H+ antiporter